MIDKNVPAKIPLGASSTANTLVLARSSRDIAVATARAG
jgi:hypothetical protein